MPPICAIFTYGTLKRGEINFGLLASYAQSIEAGWVQGRLYDVGDFPAMAEGDGRVQGEIVHIAPEQVDHVLAVVDRLENYTPGNDAASMYTRHVVKVTTASGSSEAAHAYFYNPAHPSLPSLDLLPEVQSGEWHGSEVTTSTGGDPELDAYRQWVRSFTSSSDAS